MGALSDRLLVGILGAGRMAQGFDDPRSPHVLSLAHAVQAFTAPNAQRSMQGTCTYPATGSQVIPR